MPLADRLALSALIVAALAASDYSSAKRKIDLIEDDRAAPNSRIVLTVPELIAYAKHEAPAGVRDPRIELGENSAVGFVFIDFLKLRAALGEPPPNPLIAGLLEGERPVRVTGHLSSSDGRATIDVDSVEISGVAISGRTLDFVIKYFLIPNYPAAKIGQPFDLGHNIERVEAHPGRVDVVIGK